MRVRYHQAWPAIAFILGVFFVVVDVMLLADGRDLDYTMLVGPLFILLGVQQLTMHYFDYDPNTVTIAVKPVIGRPRPFGGANGGRLFVVGNQVKCVLANGRTRRVPVTAWFARSQEWKAVLAALSQQAPAR
jgi:hypothetical protein